ncbi:MAG TPA: elongation factor G [Ignavibacteria bacterium]|nr:elongation factor G [Ignavibacteria bacterium]HRJ03370.1 elongation factor G [Ignavibacteria bacterium]
MGNITPEKIRNVVIAGHGGSGKTLLAESILYTSGTLNRLGKIEEGSTASDYSKDEISRKISINSSVLNTTWEDYKLNIIDTPGYTDFTGSVKSSMRIMDTALITVNASEGVEVGTEIAVNYAKEYGIEICFVVNKLDNEKSDFDSAMAQLKENYGSHVAELQFPVNQGFGFDSIVDVLKMKLLKFNSDGKGGYTEHDIPDALKEKANALHQELIEIVAEEDEEMMSRFFDEGGTLTEEELIEGLSREIKAKKILPVLCTAGLPGIGVRSLTEFICKYCPSPLDAAPFMAKTTGSDDYVEVAPDPDGAPAIFVFKTLSEPHVGEMSFFRVLSGSVTAGMDLTNQNRNKVERLTQIFQMNGKNRKDMASAVTGDIGAVVKLKDTHVNNTLTGKGLNVMIDPIIFPEALIEQALKSKQKGDEDKIASGLSHLHEEDPTFLFHFDPELGQTIISGQGELHLAIIIARLKEKYGVEVNIVQPKIPFRETIKGKVEDVEYKHKKQSGGHGQYGHVHLRVEPQKRGAGFEFANEVVGGAIPTKFIPAVEKGVVEALVKGPVAHYPVVDVKVTVHFGSYHDVDSSEMAFKIAGAQAFKKGFMEAKPVLLEPIYEIEVTVPEVFMGDVMGDISSRRGKISGMDTNGKMQIIKATVPLAEIHDYATKLRSITQGRGIFKRRFSHYEEVPKEIESKIVAEAQKEQEAAH